MKAKCCSKQIKGIVRNVSSISYYLCFDYYFLISRLLKGRSMPGKVLLTRRSNVLDHSKLQEPSPNYGRSFSFNDADTSDHIAKALEVYFDILFV